MSPPSHTAAERAGWAVSSIGAQAVRSRRLPASPVQAIRDGRRSGPRCGRRLLAVVRRTYARDRRGNGCPVWRRRDGDARRPYTERGTAAWRPRDLVLPAATSRTTASSESLRPAQPAAGLGGAGFAAPRAGAAAGVSGWRPRWPPSRHRARGPHPAGKLPRRVATVLHEEPPEVLRRRHRASHRGLATKSCTTTRAPPRRNGAGPPHRRRSRSETRPRGTHRRRRAMPTASFTRSSSPQSMAIKIKLAKISQVDEFGRGQGDMVGPRPSISTTTRVGEVCPAMHNSTSSQQLRAWPRFGGGIVLVACPTICVRSLAWRWTPVCRPTRPRALRSEASAGLRHLGGGRGSRDPLGGRGRVLESRCREPQARPRWRSWTPATRSSHGVRRRSRGPEHTQAPRRRSSRQASARS